MNQKSNESIAQNASGTPTPSDVQMKHNQSDYCDQISSLTTIDDLSKQINTCILEHYHHIGQIINENKMDESTLKLVAHLCNIDPNVFDKARRFHKKYSEEQLRALASGHFVLSWRHFAKHLFIPAHEVINIYRCATSYRTLMWTLQTYRKRMKAAKACSY